MPRPYSEGIPAGDPTNIYALITNGIDVPTVQFTPQDRVAEPYNEWAALNRILNTGTAAAAEAMNFKAQQIENKTAYVNLVNRLEDDAVRTQQENKREFDRQVKEKQDDVFMTYKTKVQRAALDGDYDTAEKLAMEFAQIPEYSVEKNPYMAERATDLVGYADAKKKQAEIEKRTELKRLSSAAQSKGTLHAAKVIESLEIQFRDDAQRARVMGIFETAQPEQITERMQEYVLGSMDPAQRALLDEQDLDQLTTYIWDRSATLRNGVTDERNRARVYQEAEIKSNALLNDVLQVKDVSVDVPNVLEFFGEIDANPDFTNSQRSKLKSNGVTLIVDQAKRSVPVRGALDVRDEVRLEMQRGRISPNDAMRISAGLSKRAERELEDEIAQYETRAMSAAGDGNETVYLALDEEFKGKNPAIVLAEKYGLVAREADGTYIWTADPENAGLKKKLEQFQNKWIAQTERYGRETDLKSDIDTINIIGISNFQYDQIVTMDNPLMDATARGGISGRDQSVDDLTLQNFNMSAQFVGDPNRAIAFRLAAYRTVKQENERLSGIELTPEYQTALEELRTGSLTEREAKLKEVIASYTEKSADGVPRETSAQERKFIYTAMDEFMEASIPNRLKEQANNPASNLDAYDPIDFANLANTNAAQLYKNRNKLTPEQRTDTEDRLVQMLAAGDTTPKEFIKYIAEEYMFDGASDAQLAKGYELFERSQRYQLYRDPNSGIVHKLNFPTTGQIDAEMAIFKEDPLMYNTMVIAQGLAIGTGQDVSVFLPEAHRIALRVESEKKDTSEAGWQGTRQMLPEPFTDQATKTVIELDPKLIRERHEQFRTVFNEVFGVNIPYAAPDNPWLVVDIDDRLRMEAMFQTYLTNFNMDRETAMRSTMAQMGKLGYKVLVPAQGSTTARVSMVYDPFNIIPSQRSQYGTYKGAVKHSPDFREYVLEKQQQAVKDGVIRGTVDTTRGSISLDLQADLSTPDAKVPMRIEDGQGNLIYLPEKYGVSELDYRNWLRNKTTQRESERIGLESIR